ncbi:MAG: TFIIB-type zinc ribbon-containing protein [Planctomycetota bacterium]|jgi:Zn-finger nucleic acid-binding protein
MECIKCGGETTTVNHQGIELDQCSHCSGIWFDLGELEEVLEQGELAELKNRIDNNQAHDEKESPCPRCGGEGRMVPVVQIDKGFHIDTCTCCYGHWLDGGELEKLKGQGLFEAITNWLKQ